jgi:hypothetical protein
MLFDCQGWQNSRPDPGALTLAPCWRPDPSLAAAANPWAPLLEVGLQLLQTLASAQSAAPPAAGQAPVSPWLERDTRSGQTYLKLPVPEPATVQKFADALSGLLAGLRR